MQRPFAPLQCERIVETRGRATGHIADVFHLATELIPLTQTIQQPRVQCSKESGFLIDGRLEFLIVLNHPRKAQRGLFKERGILLTMPCLQ